MEILFAVIAFIAFSVITDAIEGQKKKRQQRELPPRRQQDRIKTQSETREMRKHPEIVIPPIKNAPSEMESKVQVDYAAKQQKEQSAALQAQYAAMMKKKTKREENDALLVAAAKETVRRPTDIHSDVLLNAVAYAQILQPPKAYQYMATRSCRGDWGNHK